MKKQIQMIDITEVTSKRDINDFLNLPYNLFHNHENFIAPPKILIRDILKKENNPYFRDGELKIFLARKEGKIVGRAMLGYSGSFVNLINKREGIFSLFDFTEDYGVFKALVDAMKEAAKRWNLQTIKGPMAPDGEDNFRGLLTEGFHYDPYFLTNWNPPYYEGFYERYGFSSYNTLYALKLKPDALLFERFEKLAEKTSKRYGLTIRPFEKRYKEREISIIKRIIDETFTEDLIEDWGDFLPPDEEGIRYFVNSLSWLAEPRLVLLAFAKGEPAGLVVGIPDYNRLFKGLKGNIFPKAAFRLLFARKRIDRARILIFVVSHKHRNKGVDLNLMYQLFKNGMELGYNEAEGSSIGEENYPMWKAVAHIGGKVYKKYKFYALDTLDTRA